MNFLELPTYLLLIILNHFFFINLLSLMDISLWNLVGTHKTQHN